MKRKQREVPCDTTKISGSRFCRWRMQRNTGKKESKRAGPQLSLCHSFQAEHDASFHLPDMPAFFFFCWLAASTHVIDATPLPVPTHPPLHMTKCRSALARSPSWNESPIQFCVLRTPARAPASGLHVHACVDAGVLHSLKQRDTLPQIRKGWRTARPLRGPGGDGIRLVCPLI